MKLLLGGNSDPRNETVLRMFNLIKIGERAGTGIQTILYAIKQNGFRPLTIEEIFNPDRTKLVITFKKENQFLEEPIRRFSSNIWLSKDENKVLELIKSYGRITRLEIEEKLEFGKTKSNSILNSLIKKDFILKIGNGRSTEYLIK